MPECYGWIDMWDDYCMLCCPYSFSCERCTFDEYWYDEDDFWSW